MKKKEKEKRKEGKIIADSKLKINHYILITKENSRKKKKTRVLTCFSGITKVSWILGHSWQFTFSL